MGTVSKKPTKKKKKLIKAEPNTPAIPRKTKGKLSKKDIKEKLETLIARGEYASEYNFDELSESDKYFCELFASDQEFFGNGVQSFIKAYKPNMGPFGLSYKQVKAKAVYLLAKPIFLAYINHVMEIGNLNDQYVDNQLHFLIVQMADFGVKLGAIKHYDVKKGRIIKKFKLDKGESKSVTPEEAGLIDEIFDLGS